MNIRETISRLRAFKEDLGCLCTASQEKLRAFVIDRELPLEERFQVWIDFCDKKNQRGADWDHFLDLVDEHILAREHSGSR